jgi:hypothetical protein
MSDQAKQEVTVEGGSWVGEITQTINYFFGDRDEQRSQRNRHAMLKRVKNFWVEGVLENSLYNATLIELGLKVQRDAVARSWEMVLQVPDQDNRTLPQGTKLITVFDEMGCALLILGEPGSGKSTMLLDLARDTIARAETDPNYPIPVVFNLSSWSRDKPPLFDWLIRELNTKYNNPKPVAQTWIENDDLLLLLDGLDEVAVANRDDWSKPSTDFAKTVA